METQAQAVDFAVSAWREEGAWCVEPLPARSADGLSVLVASLGAHNADSGAVGLVSFADDVFLLLRVRDGRLRMVLSDACAYRDWPLAADALTQMSVVPPEDDDVIVPVGDMALFSDLGMSTEELTLLCDDGDMYPDEVIGAIAQTLGFGAEFEAVLGRTPG